MKVAEQVRVYNETQPRRARQISGRKSHSSWHVSEGTCMAAEKVRDALHSSVGARFIRARIPSIGWCWRHADAPQPNSELHCSQRIVHYDGVYGVQSRGFSVVLGNISCARN